MKLSTDRRIGGENGCLYVNEMYAAPKYSLNVFHSIETKLAHDFCLTQIDTLPSDSQSADLAVTKCN